MQSREVFWLECDGDGCRNKTEESDYEDEVYEIAKDFGWEKLKKPDGYKEWFCAECAKKVKEKARERMRMLQTGKLPLPGQMKLF